MRIYRKSNVGKRKNLPQGTPKAKVTQGASTSVKTTHTITSFPIMDSRFASTPIMDNAIGAKTVPGEVIKPRTRREKPKTAQEWLAQNAKTIRKHKGKWVAVSSDGICGISDDFDNVFEQATANGISNPLVFKVPKGDDGRKIVSVKLP